MSMSLAMAGAIARGVFRGLTQPLPRPTWNRKIVAAFEAAARRATESLAAGTEGTAKDVLGVAGAGTSL